MRSLLFCLCLLVGCCGDYRFNFTDRVVVTGGFYEGQTGEVKSYDHSGYYCIELDGYEGTVGISQKHLEHSH